MKKVEVKVPLDDSIYELVKKIAEKNKRSARQELSIMVENAVYESMAKVEK